MVEIKLSIINNDIPATLAWIKEHRAGLYGAMVAPVPTPKSNRATLVYAMLGSMQSQLLGYQEALMARERQGK